jgi:hypothetical protein
LTGFAAASIFALMDQQAATLALLRKLKLELGLLCA